MRAGGGSSVACLLTVVFQVIVYLEFTRKLLATQITRKILHRRVHQLMVGLGFGCFEEFVTNIASEIGMRTVTVYIM